MIERTSHKTSPVIVFDFDGVVCDSTDECMVTSWNAWEKWNGRKGFRRTVLEFSDDQCEKFRILRPRVRGAGEYYILRRALAEGLYIKDQATYDRLEQEWNEQIQAFKQVFFEMRNTLRKENLEQWINLHPVFQSVVEVMKHFFREGRLYVATLKDDESVRLILKKQGIELSSDYLLDQSQITSKVQALNRIREKLKCEKSDIFFIDDNVTHLLEPLDEGYPIYLTTWNYQLDEYIKIAERNQIPLLKDCKLLLKL